MTRATTPSAMPSAARSGVSATAPGTGSAASAAAVPAGRLGAGAGLPWIAVRIAVATAGGVGLGLSFPPIGWVLLLPSAVLLLSALTRHQSWRLGAACGFGFGLAFMLVLLPWMRVVGTDAWIALGVVEAMFYAGLGAALALVSRLPRWPLWTACCWVAVELARSSVPFGGFGWGRLGFGLDQTSVAAWARYLGAPAVTGIVVGAAALVLWALTDAHRARARAGAVMLVGLLLTAGWWLPLGVAGPGVTGAVAGADQVVVAAVQGGVPGSGLNPFAGEPRVVLNNHVRATHELAERVARGEVEVPDLVFWPENSSDIDPYDDADAASSISSAVDAVGVPTLVGSLVEDDAGLRNMGIVWQPRTGPGETYTKRHLVPFGEYIPLRSTLEPLIGRLSMIPRDLVAGTEPGVLRMGDVVVGAVTCFEVSYGDAVRDVTAAGAQLLVVQTNNATYLDTGQLEQQWAISRLRAIESGRSVVVAATSGISGVVLPDGSTLAQTTSAEPAVLVQRVPLASGQTPGLLLGGWVELAAAVAAAAAVGWAAVVGRRRPVRRG